MTHDAKGAGRRAPRRQERTLEELYEQQHSQLVKGVLLLWGNAIFVWLLALVTVIALVFYPLLWLRYALMALLLLLLFWCSVPTVAAGVTLKTRFYDEWNRPLNRALYLAYAGTVAHLYALAALWFDWPSPAVAVGVAFVGLLMCSAHVTHDAR